MIGSKKSLLQFVVLLILVSLLGLYVGYSRGLMTGLEVAKANSRSAMLGKLSILKHIENPKNKEMILSLLSAEILRYVGVDDISKLASRPVVNIAFLAKGDLTIFDLPEARPANEKIATILSICREAVTSEELYKAYCEQPFSGLNSRW
jgi:hypothetical protein